MSSANNLIPGVEQQTVNRSIPRRVGPSKIDYPKPGPSALFTEVQMTVTINQMTRPTTRSGSSGSSAISACEIKSHLEMTQN